MLRQGSSGYSLFLCPLQRSPPPHVFHLFLSVPTVACQDLPVFALSPYAQPQGQRVMTRCSLPHVVGMAPCSCHVSNAWAVLPRQTCLSRARAAAGFWSAAQVSLEGLSCRSLLDCRFTQGKHLRSSCWTWTSDEPRRCAKLNPIWAQDILSMCVGVRGLALVICSVSSYLLFTILATICTCSSTTDFVCSGHAHLSPPFHPSGHSCIIVHILLPQAIHATLRTRASRVRPAAVVETASCVHTGSHQPSPPTMVWRVHPIQHVGVILDI
jgi:hypothetical protein